MKLTYSASIGNNVKFSAVSTRVLTENLLNNDKIDVNFSKAIMQINFKLAQDLKHTRDITSIKSLEGYSQRILRNVFAMKYTDDIIDSIEGDYLLYSICSTRFEYAMLADTLNKGVPVVVGGTEVTMNSFEHVRNMIRKFGCKEKNLKNLMLVNGHITPYTNLVPLIEKWQDVKIPNQNLEEIFDARKDYTKFPTMNTIRSILDKIDEEVFRSYVWEDCVSIVLDSHCPWQKCRFCTYCVVDDMNFVRNITVDEVVDSVMKTCDNLNCYNVFLADDYIDFTGKKEEILAKLHAKGIKFFAQSGVLLLKSEKYAEKICKYVHTFSVGLEYATDFGLWQLKKGYKWEEAEKAFTNIRKYYNNNRITCNLIIDTPVPNVEEAQLNYSRLLELKRKMENQGIKFVFTVSILHMWDEAIRDDFIRLGYTRLPQERISGRYHVFNEIRKRTELPFWIDLDGVPYERIDENGNVLPPDVEIVDEEIFKEIVNQDFFYSLVMKERNEGNL